jgi:hypothetical protein
MRTLSLLVAIAVLAASFAPPARAQDVGTVQAVVQQDFGAPVNQSGTPTDAQVLTYSSTLHAWHAASAAGGGVTSITGTANQVIASAATGAVTLSLPQSIGSTSNVTFATVTASGAAGSSGSIAVIQASGATAYSCSASGDTQDRFSILGGGTIRWSAGSGSIDTGISRVSAGVVALGNGTQGNASGTLNLATLGLTGGTVTTNTPPVSATQTWNAGGVTFQGILLNVTNTASAAASTLMDLQIAGSSQLALYRTGGMTLGAPTGGDKGAGTLNVAGNLYVNGTAVGGSTPSLATVLGVGNLTGGTDILPTTDATGSLGSASFRFNNVWAKTVLPIGNASTDNVLQVQVNGDSNLRFASTAAGHLKWGSGALAQDVGITRSAAGTLALTNASAGSGSLNPQSDGSGSLGGASNRFSAVWSKALLAIGNASTDNVLQLEANGDANLRFASRADGFLQWGSGASSFDAGLTRTGSAVFALGNGTANDTSARLNLKTLALNTVGGGIALRSGTPGVDNIVWGTGGTFAQGSTSEIYGPTDAGMFITAGGAASSGNGQALTLAGGIALVSGVGGSVSIISGSGAGANQGAGSITLGPGTCTGSSSADVLMQTGYPLASGSSSQTTYDRHRATSKSKSLTNNTATTFCNVVTSTSNSTCGVTVVYTITVTDAGGVEQTSQGVVNFAITNKAGTVTATAATTAATGFTLVQNLVTGTDAVSFGTLISGTTTSLQVTSNTSLTQTAHVIDYQVFLNGLGTSAPQ